jgi:hypothetical protein
MTTVTLNTRGLEVLRANLRALNDHVLTIGFQGPSGSQLYPTGVNAATVALFNEFGTRNIPARSFLRSTLFEQRERITQIIRRAAESVVEQVAVELSAQAVIFHLGQAGREIVELVRTKMSRSRGWAKANAPSTVARKGFDFPLHETGDLVEAVSWAVRDRTGSILRQGQ